MLMLTRKAGEAVELRIDGTLIRVVVVRQNHAQVWLGFDAPPNVEILREEIANDWSRRPGQS